MVLTDLQTVSDSLNMVTMTSPRRADPTHVLVCFVSHDGCSQTNFGLQRLREFRAESCLGGEGGWASSCIRQAARIDNIPFFADSAIFITSYIYHHDFTVSIAPSTPLPYIYPTCTKRRHFIYFIPIPNSQEVLNGNSDKAK
jgi:hypothetical protein